MQTHNETFPTLLAPSKSYDLDFIEEYVKYADIFEAPPEAHEAVALTAVSAVANGNVWIQNGGQRIALDNWTLLLSGSGVGRNTLVSLLWDVLHEARIENLCRNITWGSKQGFYQDLAENPRGFFVWEELAACLKALSDARFGEAKQWLTNCYDNFRKPSDIQYRKGSPQSTPPIVFSDAPRVSILATSSESWFIDSLSQEDSAGGFIPRWFLIKLTNLDRSIPIPQQPNKELIPDLADCLRDVERLTGPVDLTRVQDIYKDWYNDTRARFREQPNAGIAEAFWNRHRVHLLKLAAIYSMSCAEGLVVRPKAMEQAIESARRAEKTIFELLPTGLNREGAAVDKLERHIRLAGINGLLKSEFTRAFQDMREGERESRLRTLVDCKTVRPFRRPTAGRPAVVLVHKDGVEDHIRQFPDDEPQN
ncbi:MAG: hypothetical protein ABR921_09665 [Candidatus Sulfotelmatobacter sp.]|jgi:hypothetical protein